MTDRERIAELVAERDGLRVALEELRDGKDEPEYHAQGIGCGIEDRDIYDRYDAAEYGWDACQERYQEWIGIVVDAALSATGQQEHPDTVRLRTAIIGLQAIEAGTMNVSPSVHARACLAAIAALKEADNE